MHSPVLGTVTPSPPLSPQPPPCHPILRRTTLSSAPSSPPLSHPGPDPGSWLTPPCLDPGSPRRSGRDDEEWGAWAAHFEVPPRRPFPERCSAAEPCPGSAQKSAAQRLITALRTERKRAPRGVACARPRTPLRCRSRVPGTCTQRDLGKQIAVTPRPQLPVRCSRQLIRHDDLPPRFRSYRQEWVSAFIQDYLNDLTSQKVSGSKREPCREAFKDLLKRPQEGPRVHHRARISRTAKRCYRRRAVHRCACRSAIGRPRTRTTTRRGDRQETAATRTTTSSSRTRHRRSDPERQEVIAAPRWTTQTRCDDLLKPLLRLRAHGDRRVPQGGEAVHDRPADRAGGAAHDRVADKRAQAAISAAAERSSSSTRRRRSIPAVTRSRRARDADPAHPDRRIFAEVFDNADSTERTTSRASSTSWRRRSSPATQRSKLLKALEPYYAAIRSAAAQIGTHHEKQTFLKVIYENFYKVYNPRPPTGWASSTRPTRSSAS